MNQGPLSPAYGAFDYFGRMPLVTIGATGSVVPGLLVAIVIQVPDAATSNIDVTVADKIEVLDVICRKDAGAGAGNTMQLFNGATAISDAIACAVDKTVTRAGTIDVAQNTINAGSALRLTATRAAGTRTATVTVLARVIA
jgi:hypothetical protein